MVPPADGGQAWGHWRLHRGPEKALEDLRIGDVTLYAMPCRLGLEIQVRLRARNPG